MRPNKLYFVFLTRDDFYTVIIMQLLIDFVSLSSVKTHDFAQSDTRPYIIKDIFGVCHVDKKQTKQTDVTDRTTESNSRLILFP
jgi:hypothetical protein